MNTTPSVRQAERIDRWSEQMTQSGPPLAMIAAAIRRERDRAGISLSELAKRAGLAKSTLSQLESGTGNPSVETLWSLGVALGVPFSRLVDPPKPAVTVIRAGEGNVIHSEVADYQATLLAACPPGVRRDLYTVRAEPGSVRHSEPHNPGTIEHFWLGTGRVRIGPTDSPVELDPGDYVTYAGDIPHIFEALVPGTAGITALEYVQHAWRVHQR
jgi:transcriptional regulator with XRE-family HTH domain